MKFLINASTDQGSVKKVNQDKVAFRKASTLSGKNIVFAVVCDGMGGLQKGEVASNTLVQAFERWFEEELELFSVREFDIERLKNQWIQVYESVNQRLLIYGMQEGIQLGTTVVAMFIIEDTYIILNIGDSRVYELGEDSRVLTSDHTKVSMKVKRGEITSKQAEKDPEGHILTQCVGATSRISPEFIVGKLKPNHVYMLCSDGFRHVVRLEEFEKKFAYMNMQDEIHIKEEINEMIEVIKARKECDNISAIIIVPILDESAEAIRQTEDINLVQEDTEKLSHMKIFKKQFFDSSFSQPKEQRKKKNLYHILFKNR